MKTRKEGEEPCEENTVHSQNPNAAPKGSNPAAAAEWTYRQHRFGAYEILCGSDTAWVNTSRAANTIVDAHNKTLSGRRETQDERLERQFRELKEEAQRSSDLEETIRLRDANHERELQQLRQQLEKHKKVLRKCKYHGVQYAWNEVLLQRDEATSKLEQAESDKERLDWLEEHAEQVETREGLVWESIENGLLRAAIDAARKK